MPKKSSKKKQKKTIFKRKKYTRGGDILGVGSSGCVIRPNIPCHDYTSNSKYASKIINKDNLPLEYEIINILGLDKLADIEEHLILPLENCRNVNQYKTQQEFNNDIKGCQEKVSNLTELDNTVNIIQEYGGMDMFSYRKQNMNETVISMLPYYRQLFEHIKYLNDNGLYHRDVKQLNIVINTQTKKLKLIDIGLMGFIDEVKNIQNEDKILLTFDEKIYENGYYIWPVDTYTFVDLYEDNGVLMPILDEVITKYINTYKQVWLRPNVATNYIKYIELNQDSISEKIQKINEIQDNITNYKKKLDLKTLYNSRLDVFSLGTILLRDITSLYNNRDLNDKDFYNELNTLILIDLLNPYSMNRITIQDAYTKFLDICNRYNKSVYFDDEK